MFDYEQPPPPKPRDWTGTLIGVALIPVFALVTYLKDADMGLTVSIALAGIILAIKLRWKLRKHIWFWPTIAFVFLLHIPLFFIVRWPKTNVPMIFYTKPLGIVDFLLIMGALSLAEKIFSKDSDDDED
jgi:hypothetical protein